jgi:hypothetical protein
MPSSDEIFLLIENTSGPRTVAEAESAIARIDRFLHEHHRASAPERIELLSAKARVQRLRALYLSEDAYRVAEESLKDVLAVAPDDVVTLLALGSLHYVDRNAPAHALTWTEAAVSAAEKAHKFVRLAHMQLCRIALSLGRYDIVENSLKRMVAYEPSPSSDISLELDFLSRIPKGAVPEDLVARYRERAGSS